MNKNESKYFNTATLFDEALIELLNRKSIEYITVKEICAKAGVNRSTFYLHYESINDLVEECMSYINNKFIDSFNENDSEFMNKINDTIRINELVLINHKYLTPYLTFVKENKSIFKAALNNPEGMKANERYSNLETFVISPIMDKFKISKEKRKYILAFYISGIMAIVNEWIKNDCNDSLESIQNIILECVKTYEEK